MAYLPHLLRISCDSLVAEKVIQKPRPDDISGNEWPPASVSKYNEDDQIKDPIKSLPALDYPRGRREILIISDSSRDRADEIVRSYEDQASGFSGSRAEAGRTELTTLPLHTSPVRLPSTRTHGFASQKTRSSR